MNCSMLDQQIVVDLFQKQVFNCDLNISIK